MTDFKAIRTDLGFTQKELGELLGIDPTQISKAENGHDVPAMYEYALKGLQAEAGPAPGEGEIRDMFQVEAELKAEIADLTASNKELATQLADAKTAAEVAQKTVAATTTEQPKPKRRGLGRPKGAKIHGME